MLIYKKHGRRIFNHHITKGTRESHPSVQDLQSTTGLAELWMLQILETRMVFHRPSLNVIYFGNGLVSTPGWDISPDANLGGYVRLKSEKTFPRRVNFRHRPVSIGKQIFLFLNSISILCKSCTCTYTYFPTWSKEMRTNAALSYFSPNK